MLKDFGVYCFWYLWNKTTLPRKVYFSTLKDKAMPAPSIQFNSTATSWRIHQKEKMVKLESVSPPQQLISKILPFFSKNCNFWSQRCCCWVSIFTMFCYIDRFRFWRKLQSFALTSSEVSKSKLSRWSSHRFIFESWEVIFSW